MSTRANVLIDGGYGNLWFYRHSDGYPEGAMPTLQKFIGWVRKGKIRDNAGQAAGWLVLIGADEYSDCADKVLSPGKDGFSGWKCGAYEPTAGIHGDIEFLYVIDLEAKTISCYDKWDSEGKPEGEPLFVDTAENPWKAEQPA